MEKRVHVLPGHLLTRPVKVAVVGAGGTGSHVLTGLAQLHTAMLALGHEGGLAVTAIDDDTVSEANVGRQMFYPSDVGMHKATVLIHRINMAMGTDWKSKCVRIKGKADLRDYDMVIGCVDNRAARKAIVDSLTGQDAYWLDLGNRLHEGQVILGEFRSAAKKGKEESVRLPHAADLFPEIVDASLESEDDTPSCSLAEALEKQALFINRGMALYATNLLWEWFRYGRIEYHGVFVNLKNARTAPLAIDPVAWERFGYQLQPKKKRKVAKAA